ncbi:hypothetical protein ACQP06_03030 [Nocardia sp. CA-136227]|uniref:hypothetical protein n=1 Tax=Nocardia sp. CA-136227 TaxID=3239979 RepID=UPI003D9825CD
MDGEIRHTEAQVHYLQDTQGNWFVVGRDGWPVEMDDYLTQLEELDADVSALEPLGVTVVDVEPVSVRDTPIRKELPR